MDGFQIIKELEEEKRIDQSRLDVLLQTGNREVVEYLYQRARAVREKWYGRDVYARGLIEFTNHCRNNCFYCGIRRDNTVVERYRLSGQQILECCERGYALGYRTFVLQGGEDVFYTREKLADIIFSIHTRYPDCAITLSFGEWKREDYQCWFDAGARRYLLRHETASLEHYSQLHPQEMSLRHRMECLQQLKEIGYQVGAGFMVGSPGQTREYILKDLLFLREFSPHMVGIGPFLSQKDTPFAQEKNGTLEVTLRLLAILRLLLPKTLLPATTALGTVAPNGRELGLQAGANVVMPNLSPVAVRSKYTLYDNKICTGEEAAECRKCLEQRVELAGYRIVTHCGDSLVEIE